LFASQNATVLQGLGDGRTITAYVSQGDAAHAYAADLDMSPDVEDNFNMNEMCYMEPSIRGYEQTGLLGRNGAEREISVSSKPGIETNKEVQPEVAVPVDKIE